MHTCTPVTFTNKKLLPLLGVVGHGTFPGFSSESLPKESMRAPLIHEEH